MTILNPHCPRCSATAKSTGQQCQNPAVRGYSVCRLHGANKKSRGGNPNIDELNARQAPVLREAMRGNKLRETHGLLSRKFLLSDEEREETRQLREALKRDYQLDDTADTLLVDQLCYFSARLSRAMNIKDPSATVLERLGTDARQIREIMKQLNIRRDVRESRGGSGEKQGPQQVLLTLVQNFQAQQAALPQDQQQLLIKKENGNGCDATHEN